MQKLGEAMDAELRLGHGSEPDTTQGPLINNRAADKVNSHRAAVTYRSLKLRRASKTLNVSVLQVFHQISDAVSQGGKVLKGGKRLQGSFMEPTLLTDVTTDMLCMKEETFGPLLPVLRCVRSDETVNVTYY